MAKKLLKSRFIPPYNGSSSNLSFAKGKPGVYLIAENGKVVYVGFSETDVQKTCSRHFQSWDDPRQVRVSYRNRDIMTVRIIITTATRAAKLEQALIIKMQPRDNPNKLRAYLGVVPKSLEQILEEYENANCSPVKEMEDAPF